MPARCRRRRRCAPARAATGRPNPEEVQAGRSYAIAAIDGYGSARFFSLRLLLLPLGDIVPIPLEGDALALEGTTLNATPEPGVTGDPGQAPTVSWEWTAPGDGAVWMGMNGDDYAPRIHVFQGPFPGQLVEVFTDSGVPRGRRFLAQAGSRYQLMFSSDPGFERPFQWQLTYSRMRLTGVSPDQVLPGAAPVTVRLEDLPIGPSFRELGLVESHSETRTTVVNVA